MASRAPEGADCAEGGEALDTARLFGRAVHTLRMYPRGNELAELALEQASQAIARALPVRIELKPRHLVWNGIELDPEVDRASIAPDLYRDGIRQLELRPGLDKGEFESLLLCLARKIDPDDLSEDYVTRLWEAELGHVTVLAIDPYLDHDLPEDVLEGKEKPQLAPEEVDPQSRESFPPPPDEAFKVSPSDALRVAREIAQNQETPPWTRFVEVLVATLMSPPGLARSADVAAIVETTFQRLVDAGHTEDAARLLRRMRDAIPPGAMPPLLAAVARMARSERLRPLLRLVEGGQVPPEDARTVLLLLQPAAAPALVEMLPELEADAVLGVVVELLLADPASTREPALAAFRAGDAEVKLRLTALLGRVGGESVARELAGALPGAAADLRAELVRALGRLQDAVATQALFEVALGDQDTRCRILALRGLGRRTIPGAQERLLARMASVPGGSEERSLLFTALGRVAGEEAIPYLLQTLKPSWIPGRWNAEDARHAAHALAVLGTPRALGALENLTHSRRSLVAEICNRALFEASRKESA